MGCSLPEQTSLCNMGVGTLQQCSSTNALRYTRHFINFITVISAGGYMCNQLHAGIGGQHGSVFGES